MLPSCSPGIYVLQIASRYGYVSCDNLKFQNSLARITEEEICGYAIPSQCRTGASKPLTKLFPDNDKGCGRLHVKLVFTTSDNRTFMHLLRVLPGRIFLHAYALHCACVCLVMRSCSFHLEKKWPPPGFTSPK